MKKKYKRMLVDGCAIMGSVTGAVMWYAQTEAALAFVPKGWSDKWGFVVIASGILHKAGQSLISYLEPEKPNARPNSATNNLRPEANAHAHANAFAQSHARAGRSDADSPSDANPNPNASFPDATA